MKHFTFLHRNLGTTDRRHAFLPPLPYMSTKLSLYPLSLCFRLHSLAVTLKRPQYTSVCITTASSIRHRAMPMYLHPAPPTISFKEQDETVTVP